MFVQPSFPEFMPESNWTPPSGFPDISRAAWWSLDCETRDPHLQEKGPGFIRGDADVAGVAIHVEGFSGYYPVRHQTGLNFEPDAVFVWLADQVKHFRGELYGANLLYDHEALWFEGVRFHDDVKVRDVQVAEPLIDEETALGYSLDVLSKKYLGVGKEEDLLKQAAARFTKGYKDKRCKRPIPFDPKAELWRMDPKYIGAYAETDVDNPRKIFQDHQSKILSKEDLWPILNLESSLTPILLKMRINGVAVDLEKADLLNKRLNLEIDRYSMEIKKLVGFDPNVDSGKDMFKAYQALSYRTPEHDMMNKLTYLESGNPSFAAGWLSAQRDPLSRLIQRKRKLMTLNDDFVVGDIMKEAVRGRLHPQMHQLRQDDRGTRSGRFSSTNPNSQQVPSRHDGCDSDCPSECWSHVWGKNDPIWSVLVRELFVPDSRKLWLKGDFSQQEPRLTVHYADLCQLRGADLAVAAFKKDPLTDYHTLTTNIVNEKSGKSYKRRQIKATNLGLVYGMGLDKLCRQLGVTIEEGKEILSAYHSALPFVKALSNKVMSTAEDRGYIVTILGRRRRFNLYCPVPRSKEERTYRYMGIPLEQAQIKWPDRELQRFGIHKALNALIQGSAADQTKESMRILYYVYGIVPSLQVHDELCGSVSDDEEARTYKRVMETCVTLSIPVVCDAATGPSWGAAKQKVYLEKAA